MVVVIVVVVVVVVVVVTCKNKIIKYMGRFFRVHMRDKKDFMDS